MNTFIFLRHGETVKDPLLPAVEWKLTEDTVKAIADLAAEIEFSDITSIYSSHEHKAQKSAEPFAQQLSIPITVWDGLEEVHRGEAYLTDEEFSLLKREKLEQRDSARDGGETSNQALERFKKAIVEIDNRHNNQKILISSHGTILALYFADLKQDYSEIFNYWKNLPFCATGTVVNSKIVKDISFV
jgi:broad specificity phosphatase PhoE